MSSAWQMSGCEVELEAEEDGVDAVGWPKTTLAWTDLLADT
jgi:hypothetical protein